MTWRNFMMEMRFKQTSKVKILSLIGRGVSSCMFRVQLASMINNDLHCQDVNHGRKHPSCHSVLWFPREEHAILTHLEKSIKFSLECPWDIFLVFQACRKNCNITTNFLVDNYIFIYVMRAELRGNNPRSFVL